MIFQTRALTSSEKITLNVDEEGATQCLVAIARLQPFSRQTEPETAVVDSNDSEFVARVGLDGKFTYIDHRYSVCLDMYNGCMLQGVVDVLAH